MLFRKLAKAGIAEVEKEEGSSNAGKTVRAQGRAHLPNRFHQRFFGHARPKSACRPFAQTEKFCFPGLCVPRSARYYFGQRSERWRARLHLDAEIESGYTTGVKLYTKIVSEFEACEVQDPFGGHLAGFVFSTDKHLRKLLHTDTCKKEIVLE